MSETIKGHTVKYKVGNEWVDIPAAIINVYNIYVAYCEQNGIEPVSESEYYLTLGNVKQYAEQLAGSTENINALATALGEEGALPVTLGGTGHNHANETALFNWLIEELVKPAYGLVAKSSLESTQQTLQADINTKLNKSEITYGDKDPNEPGANVSGSIYFQYK